jgi:MFS family permease
VRGFGGASLVAVDASLRALALGTIAVLAVADRLSATGYVMLLAASSLLHAWGSAGTYTLIAELLPERDRLAGNALISTFNQASIVVGPALAGAVTTLAGPGWVIGIDAASFAILAVSCTSVAARPRVKTAPPVPQQAATGGWRTILGQPNLLGLLAITCVFFFLYGPVEVALPIYIAHDLHGSSALLGAYWTAFGIGAVVGGLAASRLRNRRLSSVVVAIIIGWGAALLPIALTHAVWAGLLGLSIGGLIYGPFTAICAALFQRASPPHLRSRVLATRTALTIPSAALGTLAGGPVVTAIGAQPTLLASALLTIALGVTIAAASAVARGVRPSWTLARRCAVAQDNRRRDRHGHGAAAAGEREPHGVRPDLVQRDNDGCQRRHDVHRGGDVVEPGHRHVATGNDAQLAKGRHSADRHHVVDREDQLHVVEAALDELAGGGVATGPGELGLKHEPFLDRDAGAPQAGGEAGTPVPRGLDLVRRCDHGEPPVADVDQRGGQLPGPAEVVHGHAVEGQVGLADQDDASTGGLVRVEFLDECLAGVRCVDPATDDDDGVWTPTP